MLVLSRDDGEEIQIGDDIVLTLVRGRNGSARIGITAPDDIPIMRTELMREEQNESANN